MLAVISLGSPTLNLNWFIYLIYSLINFIHLLSIMILFDCSGTTYQFQVESLRLGIDGVSLWLIWLVNLIMVLVLLSYQAIPHSQLVLLSLVGFWSIAVFIVMDLLLFFVCFEGVLIPMFFLIGWYGVGNGKIHAAYQLFLYTLFGSLFLLLALILIYLETGTTDNQVLLTMAISINRQQVLWLAFFFSLVPD